MNYVTSVISMADLPDGLHCKLGVALRVCDDLCHDLYKLSGMRVRERLKRLQRMTQPAAAASQCAPLTLMREFALFKLARNSASPVLGIPCRSYMSACALADYNTYLRSVPRDLLAAAWSYSKLFLVRSG